MSRAKLTRNQLAAFLPTPEAIKAFEQILSDVGITLPNELEAVSYTAENALAEAHSATEAVANLKQDTEVNSAVTGAQVNQLLDSLNSIAQSLALLATAPPREEQVTNPFDNMGADLLPPNVKQNADLGFFPMQWPTKNPRGNGSWADLWVPKQYTFVDNVLSLRNQSRDAGGTIYGLAAICMLDAAGTERGAFGYSRNSAIQPAGYTPDIVYVEFGDPFSGDANPSSFQLICTMAGSSAWFPGTTFVPMEHITKTGETIMRVRGGKPLTVLGDAAVGAKTGVKELRGWMTNTAWRLRERDNIDSAAWTTNMSDAGVQDDAAKSSWKVKIGYGNTDDSFKIERAPAGSAVFTNFLKVNNGGRFLIGGVADDGATRLQVNGGIRHGDTTLLRTSVALTNGAAAAVGTLLNAPAVGNPTKWIPINDNGTTRYIPAW